MRASILFPALIFIGHLLRAGSAAGQQTEPPTAEAEPAGPLRVEPDSATRRLYARHRVRTVLRLRLDEEGSIRDTMSYQEFDRAGRLLVHALGPPNDRVRREWSYNTKGQCLAQIEHPSARRPFTTIYSYNPALRRGVQEVLQPDGSRLVLNEVQVHHRGDTTLTQYTSHAQRVQGRRYGQNRTTRAFEYVPHPDTVLILRYSYDPKGQPVFAEALYKLRRHGRAVENGRLDLRKIPKLMPATSATNDVVLLAHLRRLLQLGQGRTALARWHYDAQGRVVHHEQKTTAANGASVQLTQHFTYNSLDQIISREGVTQTVVRAERDGLLAQAPTQPSALMARGRVQPLSTGPLTVPSIYRTQSTSRTFFSYLPEGLIGGETTNRLGSKAIFYRYQYEFFDEPTKP